MLTTPDAIVTGLYSEGISASVLLDAVPLGMFMLDSEFHFIGCNSVCEELLGVEADKLKGTPCYHVACTAQCLRNCPVKSLAPDDQSISFNGDIITRDREKISVRKTVIPVSNCGKSILGYIVVLEKTPPPVASNGFEPISFSSVGMVASSPQMQRVLERMPDIAQAASSVLITGETGTGKDLLAEAIHSFSPRKEGQFVKVNCGALPEQLLESELFGHVKGAFTGAVADKQGRIKLAHNGTLFLTEVGDLPLHLQVKLLTFLDDQVIYPVGSTTPVSVDTRIISATHRNLQAMVDEGTFREDLLFRLNVVQLHLPTLRDRGDDVQLLLQNFLQSLSATHNKKIDHFSQEALSILRQYPFPGNIRELRNIVEYAVVFCRSSQITPSDLPGYLLSPAKPVEQDVISANTSRGEPSSNETWADEERDRIMQALRKSGGRKQKAAEILGWGRSTLWRKMKRHGLQE